MPEAIDECEIADLVHGRPTPNLDFRRGCDAALKNHAATWGRPRVGNDPDYLAAKEIVRKPKDSANVLAPGACEGSLIGGEMLRALYHQYIISQYRKPPD